MSINITKVLILMVFTLFASSSIQARQIMDKAPLYKDTKLIGGDNDKNEFFIIEANDVKRLRIALAKAKANETARIAAERKARFDLALNKALEHAFAAQSFNKILTKKLASRHLASKKNLIHVARKSAPKICKIDFNARLSY